MAFGEHFNNINSFFWQTFYRFIFTNSTGGCEPLADRSPGVTPVLPSLHWQIDASTLDSLWGLKHLWEPEPQKELELEPELQLQSGPWFEPWTWPLAGRAGDPWQCRHEHVSRAWGEWWGKSIDSVLFCWLMNTWCLSICLCLWFLSTKSSSFHCTDLTCPWLNLFLSILLSLMLLWTG